MDINLKSNLDITKSICFNLKLNILSYKRLDELSYCNDLLFDWYYFISFEWSFCLILLKNINNLFLFVSEYITLNIYWHIEIILEDTTISQSN